MKTTGSRRRLAIGVVGDVHMGSKKRGLANTLGRRLIDENYRILTGGHGDLARSVAEGARKSKRYREGDLIAILPGFDPSVAEEYSDIAIATGLDNARNFVVANSDAVIAIGGGAGTLSEIAFAWALKRLILAYRVEGWSGKLAGSRIDSRVRYPKVPNDQVYPIDTAEEAISHLLDLLPKYDQRHSGIAVRERKPS